jgi:UDP-N-acetylmuramoylalanine--D-glutamate ligase
LLYECIKKQTSNVVLAGNIGMPLISMLDKINNYTVVILEMSSFQLEDMHELKMDISCILNLSVNHLDNVPSLEYYYNSKFNICNLQTDNDYLVIDENDDEIKNRINNFNIKSKRIDYSKISLQTNNFKLKGEHNLRNIKAVLAILNILSFDIDLFTIKNFKPLIYHLEETYMQNNILVVNDSKSTSAESLKRAIETYLDKNIILIFGGKNKGGDFRFLNDYKLKKKICYGQLSNELTNVDLDYKNYALDECVMNALSNAKDNDVILFSCGCASFDQFSSYKERGKAFDELIKQFG